MRKNRVFAWVLTLCLLFGMLSPAAVAVTSGETAVSTEKTDSASVSGSQSSGLKYGKDEDSLSYSDGQWLVTSADGTISVAKNDQLPDFVKALREASEYFDRNDSVAAFVTLDDAPTSERYGSIKDVPASVVSDMEDAQNALVGRIEDDVLGGEALEVITQFTYLTNSVVINTAYGNLEAIAGMKGVKSVFISPVYYAASVTDELSPYTASSADMTGVSKIWDTLGYTGQGMTIAILDTGLDLDHPSFAAAPEGAKWSKEDIQTMLDTLELNAEALHEGIDADYVYYSEKVPFRFNYALKTNNVLHNDSIGDHGTHVAGIAAANDLEGSGVVGMAPDAQLIVMKVFNSNTGGSNMYDLIAALEDCMLLGVDVVNMSLGSAAGFSESNIEEIDDIFNRISETDIIVDIAAGNDGTSMGASLYGNSRFTTEDIDNATVASPSTYANAMCIASASNDVVYTEYFLLDDGTVIHYMQPVEYLYGYITESLEVLSGKTYEYVIVPNLGEEADFYDVNGKSIVDGKIAVVKRGTINFSAKANNAAAAGAVACLIWDNVDEDIFSFGMSLAEYDDQGNGYYPSIPTVLITKDGGQKMASKSMKYMRPQIDLYPRKDTVNGHQMSSFSGWGVSPELRLLPDLTGVGGYVYSCYDGGLYGNMSGTSMATPQVAGATAIVLQYLKEAYPNATEAEIRVLVDSLMMSTATVLFDYDGTKLEYSPRQQGAGLVNVYNAIMSKAYLTVEGSSRPKASMGDSEEGKFSFTFTIHNDSDAERVYTLTSSLLCEDYTTSEDYPDLYFIAMQEHKLDESAVKFSADRVSVAAGGTADVTVTIELTKEDKDWIDTYFPSGNYIEGFVYAKPDDADGITLSMPFLGFYRDWTEPRVFDSGMWYHNGFWSDMEQTGVTAAQFYNALFTSMGTSEEDWMLGINPYTAMPTDEDGNIIYDSKHNVLSPNGDGILDNISDYYLSLMRNVKWLRITYTDQDGNVLHEAVLDYLSKTMYNSSYGMAIPFVFSWDYPTTPDYLYDFTDADGNYLPDGTELTLTLSAILTYEDSSDFGDYPDGTRAEPAQELSFPIYIDTTAPVLVGDPVESTEDGRNYMTFTFQEANPAAAVLMNTSGSMTYGTYSDYNMIDNGDGTYSVKTDVTGLGDNFVLALTDYGCNEVFYGIEWSESGTNNPELDPDALYAYRVYDLSVGYYYGSDYMYGWGVIDKETGFYTEQRSDAKEYYAIMAAEYVDGYVFAVDAGNNFIVMQPGLWNRTWLCNLGVYVLDMAFDDTTGKMYLATKTKLEDGFDECALYTVDLLTGETELLYDYGSEFLMPWAMTFVDGKLYAAMKWKPYLYEVDLQTFKMTPVCDSDGNNITLSVDNGTTVTNLQPGYAQSMTYSEKDGKIYWAYYAYDGGLATLLTIDPTDWSYTHTGAYEIDQEYVALLTLDEGNYRLPESDGITKIALSETSLVMLPGHSESLTCSLLPWNAPVDGGVVWTSSNDAVATVEDGTITAVSAGNTVITATYGNVSAQCTVKVPDVKGTLHGANIYSDDAEQNWFTLDLATMTVTYLDSFTFEIAAADYNGHDGCIYAYDVNGCFYKIDADGKLTSYGVATNYAVNEMTYDYSTGYLYALTYNEATQSSTICLVNTSTGALIEYATISDIFITLTCDMEGNMYGIDSAGDLYRIRFAADNKGDYENGESYYKKAENVELELIVKSGKSLRYYQSMCYDSNNNTILWAHTDEHQLLWIDLNEKEPQCIELDLPESITSFQYTGLYVIPESIPELSYKAVDYVEAKDICLLETSGKSMPVTVYPLNATNQTVTYVSDDESIVRIENNRLVAGNIGSTTIRGTLVDGDKTIEVEFTATVKPFADNLYGYQMYDLSTTQSGLMVSIDTRDPANYQPVNTYGIADDGGTLYGIEAAVYVANEGLIYAFGGKWDASVDTHSYFMTIDPHDPTPANAWQISGKLVKKPKDFSTFIYDMAFDYTTGTMYAVGSPSGAVTYLYYVDMEDGELTPIMSFDQRMMSLTIDENGNIYTMTEGDSSTRLCKVNVAEKRYSVLMETGVQSNKTASMAYDFDTGFILWNAVYRASSADNVYTGLYMIDLSDLSVSHLGRVGKAGAQIAGMMCLADEYPEIPDELKDITFCEDIYTLSLGESSDISYLMHPYNLENAVVTWSIEDPTVATVNEQGMVRALKGGKTTVTLSITYADKTITRSAVLQVYGEDEFVLTYDNTTLGFVAVSRTDPTNFKVLSEGEKDQPAVNAFEVVNGIVYGYDENGDLFVTSAGVGYKRTVIGNHNVELDPGENGLSSRLVVRDMAWDSYNQRMLVLAIDTPRVRYGMLDYDAPWFSVCKLYEADLTTGALTELVTLREGSGDDWRSTMLTVDNEGNAYIFTFFMSIIYKINVEEGIMDEYSNALYCFQRQGFSATDSGALMAMDYDEQTNSIYVNFALSSTTYIMFRYDLEGGKMHNLGYIGEYYQASEYAVATHTFSGFALTGTHTHDESTAYVINAREATCDQVGYTGDLVCGCGNYVYQIGSIIPATGEHRYEEVSRVEPTCSSTGLIVKSCTGCGRVTTEVIPMLSDHLWDEGKTTVEPGCATKGEKTFTCLNCGTTETAEIVATGDHTWSEECEIVVGHEPTCTKRGIVRYYCTECKNAFFEDSVFAEHKWQLVETVTAPTCTASGVGNYECSACHETKSDELGEPDPEAHNYIEIERSSIDCTADTVIVRLCTVCGGTVTEIVPAAGAHSYELIGHVDATTASAGMDVKKCSVCGDVITESIERLPEPEKPVDPTEPTEPEKPTEPTTPAEPTEPTTPTEPTEPATAKQSPAALILAIIALVFSAATAAYLVLLRKKN